MFQPVHLPAAAPQKAESLSPCLVGSAGRNTSGSGKAGAGWLMAGQEEKQAEERLVFRVGPVLLKMVCII